MQHKHTKNRSLSLLLAAVLIFTLLPIAASAANATGTAAATRGTSAIFVSLTGDSQFSNDNTAVENTENWTLIGGSQTIASVAKTGATSATVTLSAPITAGDSFTLDAAVTVFATGTEPFTAPLSVTVLAPEDSPCVIETTGYPTLESAIISADSGDTIRFLKNYNHSGSIVINKDLTFDLDGRRVNITATGIALTVDDAIFTIDDTDSNSELNVEGTVCGILADGSSASATVTNATATGTAEPIAALAKNGGSITITGDATATNTGGIGAVAESGGTIAIGGSVAGSARGVTAHGTGSEITVNGDSVTADAVCVLADAGATVTVNANVSSSANNAYLVVAQNGGAVDVTGDLLADGTGSLGVQSESGSNVTVNGDISATRYGARSYSESHTTVNGSISVSGPDAMGAEADGSGVLNVSGELTVTGANAIGIFATLSNGQTPTVGIGGRVTVTGAGTKGVLCRGSYVVTNGDLTVTGGDSIGIQAELDGHISIGGSVTASSGGTGGSTGVDCNSAQVEIVGSLTAPDASYIKLAGTNHLPAAGAPDPDNGGYLLYSSGTSKVWVGNENYPQVTTGAVSNVTVSGAGLSGSVTSDGGSPVTERGFVYGLSASPSTVTGTKITSGSGTGSFTATLSGLTAGARYYVRAYAINANGIGYGANASFYTVTADGNACAIGDTEYPELGDALADVTDDTPVTIRLLRTVTADTPIILTERHITFDLSGYNLTLDASGSSASATLTVEDGSVDYTGAGSFAVIGSNCAVYAIVGSTVTVSSATITASEGQSAVYVGGEGSLVTVNGPVAATGMPGGRGVQAEGGGKAVVNGSITANKGVKSTDEDSLVTVTGTITAGYGGVSVHNKGKAVTGDIVVSGDSGWTGVYADGGGEATVNGSVSVSTAGTGIQVYMQDDGEISKVTVNGSVSAAGYGVSVYGGDIHITGSVVSQNFYGVQALHPSAVTIDGEITAPSYIDIMSSNRTKESKNSIDGNGYWVYNGTAGSNITIKVGNHATPVPPTVATENVLQAEVTKSGARLRGSVSAAGSSPVTAYGFVWNTGGSPTITSSPSIAGTGEAASFTADLAGRLLPGTTYYVRAFATSGAGTAYGQERIFTTRTADPPGAPVNLHYLAHDGAVELLWDAPNDGGSPILYYELMYGNDLANGTWLDIGNVSSYTWSGLTNGQSTAFNLRAVNAVGPGERSYISPTPNIPKVPGPPRDLSASPGNGYVSVSWNAPWFNGYREILGYQVSMDGSTWSQLQQATSHTFPNLTNDVTYNFYVRALNTVGMGEAASIKSTPRTYGGGSVGGGPSLPAYQATVEGGGTPSLPVSVNSSAGSATVDLSSIADEIPGGGKTVVTIPSIPQVSSCTIKFPASALSGEGDSALIVDTERGEITLPDNMLTGTGLQGNISITISPGNLSNLSKKAQEAIGSRPLIQLLLTVDGIQTAWNNPAAPVTVTIPYTPTKEELENPEGIVIWYIDGAGNMVCVPNGHYDSETGTVTFTTTHFSYYAVGYNRISFNDVAEAAWYSKAIFFLAARGITTGTGSGTASPTATLTRGQFIVLLMKAYGIEADMDPTDNFSDAGSSYYTNYLAAAKRLGITDGVGNNRFAPEQAITRQELFALLYNALNIIGRLPQGSSGRTLSDFADAGQVGPWAKEALTFLVKTGIVGGNTGKLNPTSMATRAEMAQVLYKLLSE